MLARQGLSQCIPWNSLASCNLTVQDHLGYWLFTSPVGVLRLQLYGGLIRAHHSMEEKRGAGNETKQCAEYGVSLSFPSPCPQHTQTNMLKLSRWRQKSHRHLTLIRRPAPGWAWRKSQWWWEGWSKASSRYFLQHHWSGNREGEKEKQFLISPQKSKRLSLQGNGFSL